MASKFNIDAEEYMIKSNKEKVNERTETKEISSDYKKKRTEKKVNESMQTKQVKKEKNSFDFSKVFSEGEKGNPTTIKLNDLQKEVLKLTADALGINDGQSGIIREALNQYFQKLEKNEELKKFIETMLKYKKII